MPTSSEIRRFFRTPKGLVLIVLAILVALAAPHEGITLVFPGLASAVSVAALIDALILRKRRNAWEFPDGAILTGLLVAMVLSPAATLVRRRLHLGGRHRQQVHVQDPFGKRF